MMRTFCGQKWRVATTGRTSRNGLTSLFITMFLRCSARVGSNTRLPSSPGRFFMSEPRVQETIVAAVERTNKGKTTDVCKKDSEQKDVFKKTGTRRIWIDLDNSPHVPFFLPIAEELRKRGYEVILTARDSYQVCDLVNFHNVACAVIGKHWGRHRLMKIFGTFVRALQLVLYVRSKK